MDVECEVEHRASGEFYLSLKIFTKIIHVLKEFISRVNFRFIKFTQVKIFAIFHSKPLDINPFEFW